MAENSKEYVKSGQRGFFLGMEFGDTDKNEYHFYAKRESAETKLDAAVRKYCEDMELDYENDADDDGTTFCDCKLAGSFRAGSIDLWLAEKVVE